MSFIFKGEFIASIKGKESIWGNVCLGWIAHTAKEMDMSVKVRTGLAAALMVVLIGVAVIEGAHLATKIAGIETDISLAGLHQSNGEWTDRPSSRSTSDGQVNRGKDRPFHQGSVLQPRKVTPRRQWKIWKTIKLGTVKNADGLRMALKSHNMEVEPESDGALDDFRVATVPTEVDLVRVKLCDFDFPRATHVSYDEVCRTAVMQGLQLCPPEVGPQLRLQYPDQPSKDAVIIAMPAVMDKDGRNLVFVVKNFYLLPSDNKPCLGNHSSGSSYWTARGNSETEFIFVLPRE